MGGLVSDIGKLFGGSSAKTDRKKTLEGYGDLSNLFNFGFTSGKNEAGSAQDLLEQAGGYYSKLLSGDRTATLQAVAPVANAATAQTDAAKRQLSTSGTSRGGGVNATGQTLEDQKRAQVDSAINEARSKAAGGATQVGGTMASQAGQLLGVGTDAATELTDASIKSRPTSFDIHNATADTAGDLTNKALDILFA